MSKPLAFCETSINLVCDSPNCDDYENARDTDMLKITVLKGNHITFEIIPNDGNGSILEEIDIRAAELLRDFLIGATA